MNINQIVEKQACDIAAHVGAAFYAAKHRALLSHTSMDGFWNSGNEEYTFIMLPGWGQTACLLTIYPTVPAITFQIVEEMPVQKPAAEIRGKNPEVWLAYFYPARPVLFDFFTVAQKA